VWFADSGGLTASGERNEPGTLSAAHRSLPFGTEVEVENLANGRSVVVRVNDRGPFTKNRIISVSSAAADKLRMKSKGIVKVRLTVIDGDNPPDETCGAVATEAEAAVATDAEAAVAAAAEPAIATDAETAVASYAEVGGDLPFEEPATAAEAEPAMILQTAVVAYSETDAEPAPETTSETTSETISETALEPSPEIVDDRMAERFDVAFQPESWQDLELKRVMEAAVPRLFADRLPAKSAERIEPVPVEPAPANMMFSTSLAENWPMPEARSAIDFSPAALSAP
jgi:rare lipoprotein A